MRQTVGMTYAFNSSARQMRHHSKKALKKRSPLGFPKSQSAGEILCRRVTITSILYHYLIRNILLPVHFNRPQHNNMLSSLPKRLIVVVKFRLDA